MLYTLEFQFTKFKYNLLQNLTIIEAKI